MRKHICVLVSICILVLFLMSGCSAEADSIRFGTGNSGGTYYKFGMALGSDIEESTGLPVEVIATTGSEGNLRLLAADQLQLALVQADTLQQAAESEDEDDTTTSPSGDEDQATLPQADGYSAIGALYMEACQIVVRRDAGIESVADLVGRRVSIGEEESGVTRNAEQILMANGLTTDRLIVERLSFTDSARALERGEIDAFFCTAGTPTAFLEELADTTDINLLSLDDRAIEQLISLYGIYRPVTLSAGTYTGVTEDVYTLGVPCILVANDSLSAETVETITACLFDNREALEQATGINLVASAQEAADSVPVTFHPGAAAYYAQQGVTVAVGEDTEGDARQFTVSVDMYQTLAIAVGILFLGGFMRKKIRTLETFCIPSPVVGGLIFAAATTILYTAGIIEFEFDDTLRTVCMVMFFTSVGFQANMRVLKRGGLSLVIFLGVITALIICQNIAAVGAADLIGVDPLLGLTTGSIPMVGGHGTAGAFGPVLEDLGLTGATTIATAAATFGLIVGSLMGGPVGRRLIKKHDLLKTAVPVDDAATLVDDENKHRRHVKGYAPAAYQLAIAMGIGTLVSWALTQTGMNFPVYIGAMIVAAVMRNVSEYTQKFDTPMGEINDIGGICLNLYLGMAMISLQLWQLADLALPLLFLLGVQVILMFVFAYVIVFNAMGRDYDAAVLAAGSCGFGMGATPNAMANMQAITEQFLPSVKAYLLVPIVGSMFADFINSLTITFFMNMV